MMAAAGRTHVYLGGPPSVRNERDSYNMNRVVKYGQRRGLMGSRMMHLIIGDLVASSIQGINDKRQFLIGMMPLSHWKGKTRRIISKEI